VELPAKLLIKSEEKVT
jgi:hypothetical protein